MLWSERTYIAHAHLDAVIENAGVTSGKEVVKIKQAHDQRLACMQRDTHLTTTVGTRR